VPSTDAQLTPVRAEFIALVALTTSLVAMSIDTMLPALGAMAQELGAAEPNDRQLVLSTFFLGLSVGQLLYGPISDSTGRRPALYAGLALFVLGNLLCATTTSFHWLLIGRALSGFGAAGPRIVAIALVRDLYEGRRMARVMSFVQSVFILVPVVAPSLGQGVLGFTSWRAIFFGLLAVAALDWLWFLARQPETLPPERRRAFSPRAIWSGCKETFQNRLTLGYTLGSGFVFGAFIAYLSTSQQVFQEQYALGDHFPLLFGLLASGIGLSSFLNGNLVMRFGMRRISRIALLTDCALGLATLALTWSWQGRPPLALLVALLFGMFFCNGVLFGNFSARAMQPVGHIAGVAAAATNSLSGLVALALGTAFGRAYDGTALPLVAGYATSAVLALIVTAWAERSQPTSS
jgi:DHA1 family bicyclomycin/chloramphenicol resistance-like MFS transporter